MWVSVTDTLVLAAFFPGRENWLSSKGAGVGMGRGGQSMQAPLCGLRLDPYPFWRNPGG